MAEKDIPADQAEADDYPGLTVNELAADILAAAIKYHKRPDPIDYPGGEFTAADLGEWINWDAETARTMMEKYVKAGDAVMREAMNSKNTQVCHAFKFVRWPAELKGLEQK